MTKTDTNFLIIGAGPTGLGAAYRLTEHGQTDWLLAEASQTAGGLAGSVLDEKGFTWDLGGHVIFSHYEYFDTLLDDVLKDGWLFHKREASVWLYDQFIPYPFQNNIWRLPKEALVRCLDELLLIWKDKHQQDRPANFHEWIEQNYGPSLSEIFFLPYNRKVWAYEPREMSSVWIGERVARVNLPEVVKRVVLQVDDAGWGPNATFRFPLSGGTGAIWRTLLKRLPEDKIRCGARVVEVNPHKRSARFEDGSEITYEHLLSTMPLNVLLKSLQGEPALSSRANQFKWSSTHIVGVGVEGAVPEQLANKFWMYFPAPELPFYRVTIFSNYSKNNVAKPGEQWSLLCEVSESTSRFVDQEKVVDEVVDGLIKAQLLTGKEKLSSLWHQRLEYGYPTPFLGRDELLDEIEPVLRSWNIWTRGRFGGWRYEVANQDHSLMQGVELVDHLVGGRQEMTYFQPNVVNSGQKQPTPPLTISRVAQR